MVDKTLQRTLQLSKGELRQMTLEEKMELLAPEDVDRIMTTFFAMTSLEPETWKTIHADVWIVIAAKLDNRALARFGKVNRYFYDRLKNVDFINAILLRRHGPVVFNQVEFEHRLPMSVAPNGILRMRVFEMVSEFWNPQNQIRHPQTRLMMRPAAVFMTNMTLEHSRSNMKIQIESTTPHIVGRPNETVNFDFHLLTDTVVDMKRNTARFHYLTLFPPDIWAQRTGEGYIEGFPVTQASLERILYQYMDNGFNRLLEYSLEYMARDTDQYGQKSADDLHLLLSPICDFCAKPNPQVKCGHKCESAFYCNQNCADAHYETHKCQ